MTRESIIATLRHALETESGDNDFSQGRRSALTLALDLVVDDESPGNETDQPHPAEDDA